MDIQLCPRCRGTMAVDKLPLTRCRHCHVNLDDYSKNQLAEANETDGVYSFCESVHASSRSPWHLRVMSPLGKKLGGGIDTGSLCEMVQSYKGWDLEAGLTDHHLDNNTCRHCLAHYRIRKVKSLLDAHDDALCARKSGYVAAGHFVDSVRSLLGLPGFERRRKGL